MDELSDELVAALIEFSEKMTKTTLVLRLKLVIVIVVLMGVSWLIDLPDAYKPNFIPAYGWELIVKDMLWWVDLAIKILIVLVGIVWLFAKKLVTTLTLASLSRELRRMENDRL